MAKKDINNIKDVNFKDLPPEVQSKLQDLSDSLKEVTRDLDGWCYKYYDQSILGEAIYDDFIAYNTKKLKKPEDRFAFSDDFTEDGILSQLEGFPVHMVETINKLIRVSRQLLQELGREPSPEEIAEEMKMPVERVREILKISQEPVSLETPIGEEEDSHLGDFIQDDNVPVPADAASFTLLKEQLVEVLNTLTDREQKGDEAFSMPLLQSV